MEVAYNCRDRSIPGYLAKLIVFRRKAAYLSEEVVQWGQSVRVMRYQVFHQGGHIARFSKLMSSLGKCREYRCQHGRTVDLRQVDIYPGATDFYLNGRLDFERVGWHIQLNKGRSNCFGIE